jgi:hypothetical protein
VALDKILPGVKLARTDAHRLASSTQTANRALKMSGQSALYGLLRTAEHSLSYFSIDSGLKNRLTLGISFKWDIYLKSRNGIRQRQPAMMALGGWRDWRTPPQI